MPCPHHEAAVHEQCDSDGQCEGAEIDREQHACVVSLPEDLLGRAEIGDEGRETRSRWRGCSRARPGFLSTSSGGPRR